jgi:hypothetical protein
MKKLFILVVFVLASVSSVYAQSQKTSNDLRSNAEKQVMLLSEKIDLNSVQSDQLINLYMEIGELRQEMRDSYKTNPEAAKAEYKAQKEKKEQKIKSILTADQYSQYMEMMNPKTGKKADKAKQ